MLTVGFVLCKPSFSFALVGDNLEIAEGGFFGLADESGSGKIVFAHSILTFAGEWPRG